MTMNRPTVVRPPHGTPERVIAILIELVDGIYEEIGDPVLSAVAEWLASKTGKAN